MAERRFMRSLSLFCVAALSVFSAFARSILDIPAGVWRQVTLVWREVSAALCVRDMAAFWFGSLSRLEGLSLFSAVQRARFMAFRQEVLDKMIDPFPARTAFG